MNQNCSSSTRKCVLQELQQVGREIMLLPKETVPFDEFYSNIIGGNTLRTFHRIDKENSGPRTIILNFLNKNELTLIENLKSCKSIEDIDFLSEKLENTLRNELAENVVKRVLASYNSVRKLIDLFLEQIVLVCCDLDGFRKKLIHLLRVPLDSFILNSSCLFSFNERKQLNLDNNAGGFLSIKTKEQYYAIQSHLRNVAESNKIDHPIYFDVLWRDRITYTNNILN
jgi:hypothetical protein